MGRFLLLKITYNTYFLFINTNEITETTNVIIPIIINRIEAEEDDIKLSPSFNKFIVTLTDPF
ncbi:hypothetical protein Bmyc01_23140 [Bacillus mycoides]|nr:hypothetical protein Bmyc01_23140 [Bacillus mycoides]